MQSSTYIHPPPFSSLSFSLLSDSHPNTLIFLSLLSPPHSPPPPPIHTPHPRLAHEWPSLWGYFFTPSLCISQQYVTRVSMPSPCIHLPYSLIIEWSSLCYYFSTLSPPPSSPIIHHGMAQLVQLLLYPLSASIFIPHSLIIEWPSLYYCLTTCSLHTSSQLDYRRMVQFVLLPFDCTWHICSLAGSPLLISFLGGLSIRGKGWCSHVLTVLEQ